MSLCTLRPARFEEGVGGLHLGRGPSCAASTVGLPERLGVPERQSIIITHISGSPPRAWGQWYS